MEHKEIQLSQEEMDSILDLRNKLRENIESVGKLNIRKHFLEMDLQAVDAELGQLYTDSISLEQMENAKTTEIITKYGEGKLDFATGIYTV
jgi:hypothetical protein